MKMILRNKLLSVVSGILTTIGVYAQTNVFPTSGVTMLNNGAGYSKGLWRTAAIVQLNYTYNASSEFANNRDMRFLQYGDGAFYGAGISWNLAPQMDNTFTSATYSTQQFLLSSTGYELNLSGSAINTGATNLPASLSNIMTWKGNGNVGIGTANPTQKLSVNGTIQAKEIVVNTGWSDFVFDNNYKLRPLTEVEQFIKNNKHLPEIPSQKEVEKNGVQLGDISSKLLMKIEELTLYMIEMKKENELQQKENTKQKAINEKLQNEIKKLQNK